MTQGDNMTDKTDKTPQTPAQVIASQGERTWSPDEIATLLNVTSKTFRRHLRSRTNERAGKGGKWVIASNDALALIESFGQRGGQVTAFVMKDEKVAK